MAKFNPTTKGTFIGKIMDFTTRLAGGKGAPAAIQEAEALLRRAVMTCLLWEDLAYESGSEVVKNIANLVPQVAPATVYAIALEARLQQKLRHVPLFIAIEMLKYDGHRSYVAHLLPQIITRADQLTDIMALYFQDGKRPIAKALQKGLAASFANFDEYQLAKYDRNTVVKLRDVLFLTHPKPADASREALYQRIANRQLATPDTWEVALSSGEDKNMAWTRLLSTKKLGGLALLRNLRNMTQANVDENLIREALKTTKSQWLLPLNFLTAYNENKQFAREIEDMMFRMFATAAKLKGHTVFVVDVSGSMSVKVSAKSAYSRLAVAAAMAVFAAEMCENVTIYATAGSDSQGGHATARITPHRGFALIDQINLAARQLGGGGIFTRQCLEYIKSDLKWTKADRIIVFSDSQDCDRTKKLPEPFAAYNYIVDVSAHSRGVNYKGVWSAEVAGWSEHFLTFITAFEGLTIPENNE
jgi:60 kDa SS-A/Ro ribonucleoprotein